MDNNGHVRRPPKTPKEKQPNEQKDDTFQLTKVFLALTQLPRVMRLVWSTSRSLTITMALISLASGFLPALSVWITRGVVDSVISAAFSRTHALGLVWFFVGAQLVVGLGQSLLSTLSNIAQQLLQERVSNRVQGMILEKANTLDLAFFEDAEFYDKLRNASDESSYKPMTMISQLFDFAKTLVTLFSMLFLLLNLAWWLAVIALLMPIPSFISSSRYGWRGYPQMRRRSPGRRPLIFLNALM